jgi:hypothetical protein
MSMIPPSSFEGEDRANPSSSSTQKGSFEELAALAQELQRDSENQKQNTDFSPVGQEQQSESKTESAETLARQYLEDSFQKDFRTGRWEYLRLAYLSSGTEKYLTQLRREGASGPGGQFDRDIFLYDVHSTLRKHPVNRPEHYLEAVDETLDSIQKQLADTPAPEPDVIDDAYRRHGEEIVAYAPRGNGSARVIHMNELPKDLAYKLFVRQYDSMFGGGIRRDHLLEEKNRIITSLEGFAKSALEDGAVEVALESYKRLGKLQDPRLLTRIQSELQRLAESSNPNDRQRLNKLAMAILEAQRDQ